MDDYRRIEKVILYLEDNYQGQPNLGELASVVGLSASRFQRLFTRWAGVSPKAFLQSLTHTHAIRLLEQGSSVLDASLDSGLSGPGRLHDLCVKLNAASPGEIKSGGEGWTIEYGVSESPFGQVLAGLGPKGICHLSFVGMQSADALGLGILADWPNSKIVRNDRCVNEIVSKLFNEPSSYTSSNPLQACVRGSEFQLRVWRALLEIPSGEVSTYQRVAQVIGSPSAARAVGTAVGRNSLAYLIPCHRVIRETGALGGYRWGLLRKQAMLARETANRVEKVCS